MKSIVGFNLILCFFIEGSFAVAAQDLKIEFWGQKTISLEARDSTGVEAVEIVRHSMRPEHFQPSSPESRGEKTPKSSEAFVLVGYSKEAPNTLVILFNYQKFMNAALLRASIFSENILLLLGDKGISTPTGIIADMAELSLNPVMFQAGGHDLTGRHMLSFWNLLDNVPGYFRGAYSKTAGAPLARIEREFRAFLEPLIRQNPDLVLAVGALDTSVAHTLSHELSHAQYFNNRDYKKAIHDFWEEQVTPQDKVLIARVLQKTGVYNVENNPDLLVNEFQAYTTQVGAEIMPLAPFLDPYFWKLRAFLMQRFPSAKLIKFINPHNYHLSPFCRTYLLAPFSRSALSCTMLFSESSLTVCNR